MINGFTGYDTVRREVKAGVHSRLDIMLRNDPSKPCYMEIKNCTLVENGIAYFPDAVTTRGKNHLILLRKLHSQGNRCAMFFLIQRMDAALFKPADHIDPAYGKELRKAVKAGVEIVVYDVKIDLNRITLGRSVPFELG
jgi:sugar fermentation stimulation protein A